jgi:biotin operon repressor
VEALRAAGGSPRAAARTIGLHYSTFVNRIDTAKRLYGIEVGAPESKSAPDVPQNPVQINDAIKAQLKRVPQTLEQLAALLGCSRGAVLDALDALREQGLNIHEHSGTFHWSKTPAPGHAQTEKQIRRFASDDEGWVRFGFTSDNHLCSKYERLDVLNDLYDRFAEAGIEHVLNAGNWIDGEATFNMHDLHVHGIQNQMGYLAKSYPQRDGITTYAISGDDHEGWYAQRSGVDVGKLAVNAMTDAGRSDWIDMGYMEAFFRLEHSASGASCMGHLMHPGGGSSYAVSYTVQKIVEGYDGGEKPAVLFAGHYHKLLYALVRNVHTVQTGCTQDQTPFARKKKISFNLGGGIAEICISPDTGAITRFRVEIFPFFVKSYYNNRWSHSGAVTLAERGV